MNAPFFRISHLHSATAHLPALSSILEILKPIDWQLEDGYTTRHEMASSRLNHVHLEARLGFGTAKVSLCRISHRRGVRPNKGCRRGRLRAGSAEQQSIASFGTQHFSLFSVAPRIRSKAMTNSLLQIAVKPTVWIFAEFSTFIARIY